MTLFHAFLIGNATATLVIGSIMPSPGFFTCPVCKGWGQFAPGDGTNACPGCRGAGQLPEDPRFPDLWDEPLDDVPEPVIVDCSSRGGV